MQKVINEILSLDGPKWRKISKLRDYFCDMDIKRFVDFDDTITQTHNIFYSKNRFFKHFERDWEARLKDFEVNKKFIDLINNVWAKEFVILSRNDTEFLDYFIQQTKQYFEKLWIKILCCVWNYSWFSLSSKEKLAVLPAWAYLITDIFEFRKLKKSNNVLFIEDYNIFKEIFRLGIKSFYLLKYFILW